MAFLLDSFIKIAVSVIVLMASIAIFSSYSLIVDYIIVSPISIFYTLFFEIINDGQTPGKKSVGIKVVKTNGKQAQISDYLLRWVFRLIDIYFSLGSIAAILVNSSKYSQRLGGLLSNTTVVQLQPKMNIKLKDIENLNTLNNHQILYPEIRKFSEQEMLLIKQTLNRTIKYNNDIHRQLIDELCENIAMRLNMDVIPSNKIQFLKDLIKDYVVLTR